MKNVAVYTDRLEQIYLAALRVTILVIATAFVLISLWLLASAGIKWMTSTKVTEAPVQVAPSEVVSAVGAEKTQDTTAAKPPEIPAATRTAFAAFVRSTGSRYYGAYQALAKKYDKPEDKLLSRDELLQSLGYTLDAYNARADRGVVNLVENTDYQTQILATADALTKDARVLGVLRRYVSAQKTAQRCSTVFRPRRVWDSTSTQCSNWWQDPIGCAVVREFPEQSCVAAYPDGITSPLQAFTQMDTGFRGVWLQKAQANAAAADAERTRRYARKAESGPTALKAIYVFAAFLGAMFLFLIIAIERHMRRVA